MHASAYPVEQAAARAHLLGASLSSSIVSGLVGMLDALCVLLPGIAIYVSYVGAGEPTTHLYLSALFIAALLIVAAFHAAGLYKFELIIRPHRQIRRVVTGCLLVFLILVTLAFALKIGRAHV